MALATLCLRLAAPERGYIWVTVRHWKSRRPRVPFRVQKGIPGLGVAGCTGLEPVRTERSATGLPVVFVDLPLEKRTPWRAFDRSVQVYRASTPADSSRFL